MLSAGAIQLMLAVLQAAPALIEQIKADIATLNNNGTTEANLTAKWAAMQQGWEAGKAAWAAANADVGVKAAG